MHLSRLFKQFRTRAVYYKCTEDKGVYLRCQPTGDAAKLLWAQPNADDVSYDGLERLLRIRFGFTDQKENFQTELGARRRDKDESLQALYFDIIRLMALA